MNLRIDRFQRLGPVQWPFVERFSVIARCLALLAVTGSVGIAQDWSAIRGPHYDGSASESNPRIESGPLELDGVWKKPIGSGYSGIVKSADLLVTAAANADAGQEFVMGISAVDGTTRWQTATGEIYKGENGSFDGPIATPAIDGQRAYHLSPQGLLGAYRLSDGQRVWMRQLRDELGAMPNFYGFGASPIVYDGKVILPVGSPDGAVMAFDAETGKTVWAVGEDGAGFQTCVVVGAGADAKIIAAANSKTFAIDPTDGRVLWTRDHEAASPMGTWAAVPVPLSKDSFFLLDGEDRSSGVRFADDGAETQWNIRDIRNTYCVPVVVNNVLCTYSSRFLIGLDPATGERLFRQRKPGNGFVGRIGDRLVIATLDGRLHVGDVSPDGFEEVVTAKVFQTGVDGNDGQMWSLPSLAGDSVYLRSLGAIARVDIRPAIESRSAQQARSQTGETFAKMLAEADRSDSPQAVVDQYVAQRKLPVVEDGHVHFMLRGPYSDVAVGSDLFGLRQERVMNRIKGTDWFFFAAPRPKVDRLSYAYFADYQPIPDPANQNRYLSSIAGGRMEPLFRGAAERIPMSWLDLESDPNSLEPSDRPLAGQLSRLELESKAMSQTVSYSVYTPPGYKSAADELPVVFVHDGEVALTIGGQASIVDQLITAGEIEPAVVVFIDWRFYPLMGATGYPEMFAGELIPAVESAYRISKDRQKRSSLGGGFGGTLALMASLPSRNTIGRIGCHSPFAFELMHPILAQLASIPGPKCEARFRYGTLETRNPSENWDMGRQSVAIANILNESGHTTDLAQDRVGSDWVCWRNDSREMYRFLLPSSP